MPYGTLRAAMTQDPQIERRAGLAYGLAAFLFWGFAPIYFKAVAHVPAIELLAHRIVWAVPMLAVFVWWQRAWRPLDRRAFGMLAVSALLIGTNWLVYIIAIQTDRLLEASLGYYINPLVSMVLGMIFLRERLRPFQWVAVMLAVVGTGWMTWAQGGLPWIALVLAFTFGFYGLVRKTVRAESLQGLFIETLMLAPFAYAGVAWLYRTGQGHFLQAGISTDLLLVAAGIVTTVPLYWFTQATRRLPLTTIGFMQYLAPSIAFLLAVFVFEEPFGGARLVAFTFIWSAVAVYLGGILLAQKHLY
ncbi:MAG: EamA family transporter RarD [Xanthomonadaceae bacterium]|nr:EamA family transporter RarD [Xanthomonadaceae bacterium]